MRRTVIWKFLAFWNFLLHGIIRKKLYKFLHPTVKAKRNKRPNTVDSTNIGPIVIIAKLYRERKANVNAD